MPAAALAERVVEVIADLGSSAPRPMRYGSGCIVQGRTVLTAAHVVRGAVSVSVRWKKQSFSATMDPGLLGDVGGPGPDLALVMIDDPAFVLDLPAIGLGRVDRASPEGDAVERCHAVGYPLFGEIGSGTAVMRDTVDAIGVIPVMSKLARGLLSLHVSVSPRSLPTEAEAFAQTQWSGMSGAPVFAAGLLLGVVTEHAPREGSSTISAVPLTALEHDRAEPDWGPGVKDPAAWWSRLHVAGLDGLRLLPIRPRRAAPAYRATMEEIGRALHHRMPQLLDRERELADIGAFATGESGYRWLVGGAYTGKSALLYEAVTVGLPDEVDAVCYFASRRSSDADSNRFLAAVVPQLAYLCDVDPPAVDRDQFRALWRQAADQASENGRHLLLVVDGLDEDDHPTGSPSVASLLPAMAGGRAHVLVASRPHPELPGDMPYGHPLAAAPRASLDAFTGATDQADQAKYELDQLTRKHGTTISSFNVSVLGTLTAAKGPLSVTDLATLLSDERSEPSNHDLSKVRHFVTERAARSLEPVGPADDPRYQFAHLSLLAYAQENADLRGAVFRTRIDRWAQRWHDAGWPMTADTEASTPRYLLDSYAAALVQQPDRLAALVGDVGWVDAAIHRVGVDQVLAVLRTAAGLVPADAAVAAMVAVVAGQARNMRTPGPVDQPGFAARQICIQATEFGLNDLAEAARSRTRTVAPTEPVLLWTTRRAALGLVLELGRHSGGKKVTALAVLSDGRIGSAGDDGRLLVWDPAAAGATPIELANHLWGVTALAALRDGRVVGGGEDGRVLVWDPAAAGTPPAELGRYERDVEEDVEGKVTALAALRDGRVVSAGDDGRLLLWDPAAAGAAPIEVANDVWGVTALSDGRVISDRGDGRLLLWDPAAAAGTPPVELGRHDGRIFAVAELRDGRVVTGGEDRRVLVWDPAAPNTGPVEVGSHDDWVMAVTVVGDGRVVSAGSDGRVLMWDSAAAGAVPKALGRSDGRISALVALADGRVTSGGYDGRVLVWDPAAAGAARVGIASRDVSAATVAVLADGRVVAGGKDGSVWLWDPAAAPDTAAVTLGYHDVSSHLRWVTVAALGDGRVVSFCGGQVLLWNPTAPAAAPVELANQAGSVLVVSGDRRVIGTDRHGLVVWDPADAPGTVPLQLGEDRGLVNAAALLRDGRLVGGGSDGRLRVWDPATPGVAPVELGFNPGVIGQIAALSDGRVVTGDFEGAVRLWDSATPGTAPVELGSHDGWVTAVAVLGDGRVVSGGQDGRVGFWDPASPGAASTEIVCSVQALSAHAILNSPITLLVVADEYAGLSAWTVAARA